MTDQLRLDDRKLSARELTAAATVAARAFHDDPFFVFLLPGDGSRHRALRGFFRTSFAHLEEGSRLVTVRNDDDAILGVSAWLPTGLYPQSIGTQLKQLPGAVWAFARRPRAFLDGNRYTVNAAKCHPKDPHWYLFLLVTDPSAQRRGVGTMMMEPALAAIDAEGVGGYLETQKEENLAYYRRFGYELRDTLRPVTGGPPLFTMWRAPR